MCILSIIYIIINYLLYYTVCYNVVKIHNQHIECWLDIEYMKSAGKFISRRNLLTLKKISIILKKISITIICSHFMTIWLSLTYETL